MASLSAIIAIKKRAASLKKRLTAAVHEKVEERSPDLTKRRSRLLEGSNAEQEGEDNNTRGLVEEESFTVEVGALEQAEATAIEINFSSKGDGSSLHPMHTREERTRQLTAGIFSAPPANSSAVNKLRKVARATLLASKLIGLGNAAARTAIPRDLREPLNSPSGQTLGRQRKRTIVQPHSVLQKAKVPPPPLPELDDTSEADHESDRLATRREIELSVLTAREESTRDKVVPSTGEERAGRLPALPTPTLTLWQPPLPSTSNSRGVYRILPKSGSGRSRTRPFVPKKSSKVVPFLGTALDSEKAGNLEGKAFGPTLLGSSKRRGKRIFSAFASPNPRASRSRICWRTFVRRYASLVLSPRSSSRFAWECIIQLLIFFSFCYVPLRMAFGYAGEVMDTIGHVVDALFGLDIIICYFTAVRMQNGQLSRRPEYLLYYYSTRWLAVQIFYTLPFDTIVSSSNADVLIFASDALYLSDILAGVRLLRYFRLRLYKERFAFQSYSFYRIAILLAQFVVIVVIVGATWHLIGVIQTEGSIFFGEPWVANVGIIAANCRLLHWDTIGKWIYAPTAHTAVPVLVPIAAQSIVENSSLSYREVWDGIRQQVDASFVEEWVMCTQSNATWFDPHARSVVTLEAGDGFLSINASDRLVNAGQLTKMTTALYWAMTTLTTVGYGDISPTTDTERIYATAVMLLGAITTAFLFGNVGLAVTRMDNLSERYRMKIRDIVDFCKVHEISAARRQHLLSVFEGQWMKTAGGLWLPPYLPRALRAEVAYHQYSRTIEGVELFRQFEKAFVSMVALRLSPQFFGEGDYLFREGDDARNGSLFFLREGLVGAVAHGSGALGEENSEVIVSVMQPYSLLGHAEVALEIGLRQMTLKTLRPCSVLSLDAMYLWDALLGHPEEEEQLIEDAERTLLHYHTLVESLQRKPPKRRSSARKLDGGIRAEFDSRECKQVKERQRSSSVIGAVRRSLEENAMNLKAEDCCEDDEFSDSSVALSDVEDEARLAEQVHALQTTMEHFHVQVLPQLNRIEQDYDKMLEALEQ